MADSNLKIINAITQFSGGTQAIWEGIDKPIPDKCLVVAMDTGVVKRGDGIALYANLPVLFNIQEFVTWMVTLVNKADKIHEHVIGDITGLADALGEKLTAQSQIPISQIVDLATTLATLVSQDALDIIVDQLQTAIGTKTTMSAVRGVYDPVIQALTDAIADLTNTKTTLAAVQAVYDPVLTSLGEILATKATVAQVTEAINAAVGDPTSAVQTALNTKLNKTNDSLTSPLVKDERLVSVDKGTVTSGTVTFKTADGNVQRVQIGGAVTFAFEWPTTGDSALILRIVNGGSATVTINGILFIASDGTTQPAPNVALQASGVDLMVLLRIGGLVYGKVIR